MTDHPLVLCGAYGSPYSLKMRAILRYRHIPFRWVLRDSKWDDLPTAPVPIIPVIVYPNADGSHGEATVDSSPQIMRLEREYDGRSVVPTDPALAFIDGLLEDFGDEWLTKAMYHYRWAYDDDIDKAGHLLPTSRSLGMDSDRAQQMYDVITQRQIAGRYTTWRRRSRARTMPRATARFSPKRACLSWSTVIGVSTGPSFRLTTRTRVG